MSLFILNLDTELRFCSKEYTDWLFLFYDMIVNGYIDNIDKFLLKENFFDITYFNEHIKYTSDILLPSITEIYLDMEYLCIDVYMYYINHK